MKRVLSILLMVILLLGAFTATAFADQNKIRSSVVRVIVYDENGLPGGGTGFAVGKLGEPVRYFVTNHHVVEDAAQVYICFGNSTDKIPANILHANNRYAGEPDLAVLSLNEAITGRSAAILRPFDVDEFNKKTQYVWSYGFPGVVDEAYGANRTDMLSSFENDINEGSGNITRVMEAGASGEGEQVLHSALTGGGNSGGPLVDENGYVLGANTTGVNPDYMAGQYGAVSVNEIVRLLNQLGVPYTTDKDVRYQLILKIAIAVVVVCIIAVVVILLLRKRGGANPKPDSRTSRTLVCESGAVVGKSFAISGTMRMGRDPSRCQIVLGNASGVSSVHLTITVEGTTVKVTDEHSSYGTWIDQEKLKPGQTVVMHRGQRLYLGSKKQAFLLRS